MAVAANHPDRVKSFAVRVRGLRVRRGGAAVLHDLHCDIRGGRVTGLIGPSGSGKTTLMRAIVGTQKVQSGQVEVLGWPAGSSPLRTLVGYASQGASVYPDLTVTENLRYFATVLGAPRSDVARVLALVDLASVRDQLTGRLSGGERSRVSLGVALLGAPRLLVLDEPTVGLDPVLREQLWSMFAAIAGDGTSLLVSSHVMNEAERCRRAGADAGGSDPRPGNAAATQGPDGHRGPGCRIPGPGSRSERGMKPHIALATSARVLRQLRHDPRTVVLLVAVPSALLLVVRFVFDSRTEFSAVAPALLGVFPFTLMFLVTSITTLRERTTGTLERLMTTPMSKLDLLVGYGIAFGSVALVQVLVAVVVSLACGLTIAGSYGWLLLVTAVDALLGVSLGLLASAFARTEFQALQFLPIVVFPQLLVCGLFQPRERMAQGLRWFADVVPLSYAVEALRDVATHRAVSSGYARDLVVVASFTLVTLGLAAATLRRRTA